MPVTDFQTENAYYVRLSNLRPQETPINVLAVMWQKPISHPQANPSREAAYFVVLDDSTPKQTCVIISDLSRLLLPKAEIGHCVLLRNYIVKSAPGQLYLISCDDSSCCVFTDDDAGPLVEFGDIERKEARRLHAWWKSGCPW
jgi:hypothetical protein